MDSIAKLRLYLNDREGTKFTDAELEMLLAEGGCLYCAVAEGWSLMATRLDLSGTRKYTVGTEAYEKAGIDEQVKAALRNAGYFKDKCICKQSGGGSFILRTSTRMGS